MAIIRITGLTLDAIIGINDWERTTKQKIIINIELEFDSSQAANSDNIQDTVDYKDLKKRVIDLVRSSKFFLLEKLVEKIIDLIMTDPRIDKASVKIDKPHALRFAKSVSIESSRSRKTKKMKIANPKNTIFWK